VEKPGGPECREERKSSEHSGSRPIDLTDIARLKHLQLQIGVLEWSVLSYFLVAFLLDRNRSSSLS